MDISFVLPCEHGLKKTASPQNAGRLPPWLVRYKARERLSRLARVAGLGAFQLAGTQQAAEVLGAVAAVGRGHLRGYMLV